MDNERNSKSAPTSRDREAHGSGANQGQAGTATERAREVEQTAREQEGTKLHLLAAIRKTVEVNGLEQTAAILHDIIREIGLPNMGGRASTSL